MIIVAVAYATVALFVMALDLAVAEDNGALDTIGAFSIVVRAGCWLPLMVAALVLVAMDAAAATRRR